jgi:hypothetical protein
MAKMLFAGTIFSSAFLLFLIQPIISKSILPWFGGSAGVWATCMMFFQVVLLLGYAYSDWTTRHLRPLQQVLVHGVLLIVSLLSLPVAADPSWKPGGDEDPSLRILLLLTATIGLPYFLLSTTGPMIQAWVSRSLLGAKVYRYFSLSNLASLLALVCYPFLIESRATLALQGWTWSVVYAAFALMCGISGLYYIRHVQPMPLPQEAVAETASSESPAASTYLLWLGLSALASWLLVAVTSHITQNIAAIPFLWLLPLTLYLLTFVLCFESDRWYGRRVFLVSTVVALLACAYGLQDGHWGQNVKIAVPVYSAGLFIVCMFLHGELAQRRPSSAYLTRFYLMVSLGGALGGITVAIIAPRVLPAYYELGMGYVLVCLAGAFVLRVRHWCTAMFAVVAAACTYFLFAQIAADMNDARLVTRNFYGTLLTLDSIRDKPADSVRQLYHGSIKHGEQYLAEARRMEPTTYYGPTSGIGLVVGQMKHEKKKVGLIGLGAGTLAAYGVSGDAYRFYEINPQVLDIASREFSYIRDSKAAIETVIGDAHLALEKEAPNGFDVLAVDAFSGDAVPVHLLTREAMALYARHINDDGVIAFHVTNQFLSLAPLVARVASSLDLRAVLVHDDGKAGQWNSTDWVLVAKSERVLQHPALTTVSTTISGRTATPWTDDFNNLFEALK